MGTLRCRNIMYVFGRLHSCIVMRVKLARTAMYMRYAHTQDEEELSLSLTDCEMTIEVNGERQQLIEIFLAYEGTHGIFSGRIYIRKLGSTSEFECVIAKLRMKRQKESAIENSSHKLRMQLNIHVIISKLQSPKIWPTRLGPENINWQFTLLYIYYYPYRNISEGTELPQKINAL